MPASGATALPTAVPQPDGPLRALLATIAADAPGAYLVGGAVRDLLLGRALVDVDIAVGGDGTPAAEAIASRLNGRAFVMDEERRQMRIALSEGAVVAYVDVASFDNGIEADLARRDFTVDALAAPILADGTLGALLDFHGGAADLKARVLRMVSEAALTDDPLRLLRGVRLVTELGLALEEKTAAAILEHAALIDTVAAERRRDELVRIFETPHARDALRRMDALGLFQPIFPELDDARGCDQPGDAHWYDVFDHSLEAVAALDEMLAADDVQTGKGPGLLKRLKRTVAPESSRPWLRASIRQGLEWFDLDAYLDGRCGATSRRALLKLAGLLHDVAKPETKVTQPDGRTRFFGHPELGAEKAARICRRLRLGNKETNFVALLVDQHLRPTMLGTPHSLPSHRAIYRFMRDLGEAAPACLLLALGDGASAAGPRLQPERWRGHIAYISYVLQAGLLQEEANAREPKLIDGRDLMTALELQPGPMIGRLLSAVEEARAEGEVASREEALELAQRLLQDGLPEEDEATAGATHGTTPEFDTPPLGLWDEALPGRDDE